MCSNGEKIFDTNRRKKGTIKYFRNNEYEKNKRKQNSNHYYYYIDYEDGSFDTYVSSTNFILIHNMPDDFNNKNDLESSDNKNDLESNNKFYYNLQPGQKIICKFSNKLGKIIRLRNDEYDNCNQWK